MSFGADEILRDGSLLKRGESNAIKGVLILLVVLGHNSLLMQATGLFPYIYSFHVYCFFILPYLYGQSTNEGHWRRLSLRFLRYLAVYLAFCAGCLCISLSRHRVIWDGWALLHAIITGSQGLLTEYIGFGMLWFLPAICAVLFWHAVYFRMSSAGRGAMLSICAVLWLLAALGITSYHQLGCYIPFALMPGLYHCLTGGGFRYIAVQLQKHERYGWLCAMISLTFISAWMTLRGHLPFSCYYLTWLLCPMAAMCILYTSRKWLAKVQVLQTLGELSYPIYLAHIFVYNALLLVAPKGSFIAWGMLLFATTLMLSIGLSVCARKTPFLGSLLK